jgi:uncharacterized protein YukE
MGSELPDVQIWDIPRRIDDRSDRWREASAEAHRSEVESWNRKKETENNCCEGKNDTA